MRLEDQNYNSPVLDELTGNCLIHDYLQCGKPFMVAKASNNVCEMAAYVMLEGLPIPDRLKAEALTHMGVLPNTEENLSRFARNYCECLRATDILGVWGVPYYDWLASTFCPQAHYVRLWGLEPYHYANPWSAQLKGKNVLVIHPFEKSIQTNYANRSKLFEDPNVLPDFNLLTIKAEQNLGKVDSNYFKTLERTKQKINALDFDVALIGCGAAGIPLAHYVRKGMNKTAIHLGGALQVLFGIIGKRWEEYPQLKDIINEHWTRPLPEEHPKSYLQCEHGCYW